MKPLLFSMFPPLLFFSSLVGQVVNEQVHWDFKSTPNVINSEERTNGSQQLKPALGFPWMLVYVPVRSCHRVLEEKFGEFSPPPTYNSFQLNIWCNWTIWAGSRKHIIIYIKGFMTEEDCDKNEDKILFQGVSSLIENTVIYACGNKKMHVFATYAQAVHVVFLMKYSSNSRHKYFKGKYYIFKHRDSDSSKDILVSPASTLKAKKTDAAHRYNSVSEIYHGEVADYTNAGTGSSPESLTKNLKTTVTNNTGLLKVWLKGQNVTLLGSSLQLVPQHVTRTQLLKAEEHSMLESLPLSTLMSREKSPGIAKSSGSLPHTVSSDIWQSTSVSEEVLMDFSHGYRPKSLPGLSVSPLIEPSKSIELGVEGGISSSQASLKQTNIGDLQLNLNPTSLSNSVLASYLHSPICMSDPPTTHDRVESIRDQTIDSISSEILKTVTLVNDQLQSILLASNVMNKSSGGLVKSSLPNLSMTSQDQVALHNQLQPQMSRRDKAGSYQTSLTQLVNGNEPVTELDLRKTTLKNMNHLDVSVLESSMEVIDASKIMAFTAASYGMSEGEHHLMLQSSQYVALAATEIENIFPSTDVSLHLAAKKVNMSEVLNLGMTPSQQVGLLTELEPDPSTEASLPPPASESGPALFPGTQAFLPAFPTEMEPATPALKPVIPCSSTEPSVTPVDSVLEPITFPDTEVIFPQAAKDLEPVLPSREAFLPPTQGAAALSNELHLRTKSSYYIDTEIDDGHPSTTVLLPPAALREDLLEGEHHSAVPEWVYGTPAATEHNHIPGSTTQLLNFFPQDRKIHIPQSRLDVRKESILEAGSGMGDERNLITNYVTGNVFSDTTEQQALKPELELGQLRAEGHVSKLSPVTENLAKTPLLVTRTNRVKQNELMFKNRPMTFHTRATLPLEPTEMTSKVKLTETLKGMNNTTLKQIFPDATKHPEVQETSEWLIVPQNSTTAYSDALTPAEKQALEENLGSQLVQSSSGRMPENVTSKARVPLSYAEPELPWLLVYFPVRSCHVTLKNEMGTFSPPTHVGVQTNIWCNWTIWAGPQKHILIYIKGFWGKEDCDENPDKIIFQGVLSSVERKVVYACRSQGTLIFATQALAVHVVFLSKGKSLSHGHTHFKGQYYIFKDYEMSRSTDNDAASRETAQKTRRAKYGSVRFYPKLPQKHYRGHLDFVKTSAAHNENKLLNKLPVLDKEGHDKNGSSATLEALRAVAGNKTHIPLLKAMDNMTTDTQDLKWQQSVKSLGNETSSRMVTPTLNKLRPSTQNKKDQTIALSQRIHRPKIHSDLLFETPAFKGPLKSVETQSVKETEMREPQHRPASMEDLQPDAIKAALRNFTSLPGLQYLQDTWKEQSIQRTSSQVTSIALIKDEKVLQSNHVAGHPAAFVEDMQANFRLVGDSQEINGQLRYVNLEGSIKESAAEHVHRKGNKDLHMKPASALKPVEPLALGTPRKVVKSESSLITAAPHYILEVSSNSHAENTATELKPALLSPSRSSTVLKAAIATTHLGMLATQGTTPPLIRSTKSYPSPSTDVVPKDSASLDAEYEDDSFDMESIFASLENDTVLESQHNPGDVLFEVTSEIDHKGWIPRNGTELKKAVMESIKLHVQKNLKLLISKVNEIKLKEIKRTNDLKPTFTFWIHLKPEERNLSVLLQSRLNDLIGKSTGAENLQLALLSIRDVNECHSGIGVCGDDADCLNEAGTYACRCKEGYEDRSPAKSGMLCVRIPQSGIGGFFSYMEILVGSTVFFIFILVVVAASLCTILRKRPIKKDSCSEDLASGGTPSSAQSQLPGPSIDLSNLGDHLTLDPFQPKLRAKPPAWTSQVRTTPSETYRIFVEQSECL